MKCGTLRPGSTPTVLGLDEVPSLDSYWRAIVLFGPNFAPYKFALAGALLEVGAGSEVVTLDALARPFACRVALARGLRLAKALPQGGVGRPGRAVAPAGDPGQSRERRHKPSRGTAGAVCSTAGARPLPDRQLQLPGTLEVEDYPQGSVNSAHLPRNLGAEARRPRGGRGRQPGDVKSAPVDAGPV